MIRLEKLSVVRCGARVLDGISFEARHGETFAVVGRSGSGKSTLLLAIAGAVPLDGGTRLLGEQAKIAYVPAHLSAWPVVRADEFLEFCANASGLSGKPMQAAVARGLAMAGLADRPSMRIDALSDGARKRLLIARALLNDPDLLLLDDPFASLDPAGCRSVERVIGDAGLAGRTVIAALNAAHVAECWSRVLVLEAGRLSRDLKADRSGEAPAWWGERLVEPGFRPEDHG